MCYNIILAKVIHLQNPPQKCFYPKPIEVWNKLEDDLMKNPSLHTFHVYYAVVRIIHLSALQQAKMTAA